MISKEQCIEILGSAAISKITNKLKNKNINEETINRVLDYLALHKKCFPYLDNDNLSTNLINNINGNIVFRDMIASLKYHRDNGGYTDGSSIYISRKKIRHFVLPKKLIQQRVDHIVRHELEHVAMARISDLNTNDKIEHHLETNIKNAHQALGTEKILDLQPFIQKQKERLRSLNKESNNPTLHVETGISGHPNSPFEFGSTPLNEGITELKTHMMDDIANRNGYSHKSGYDKLETKIAQHMSKIIGKERFLKMHQKGDFTGITESYKDLMGRDNTYMREFYTELDNSQKETKSISEKLFGPIGKEITNLLNLTQNKPKTNQGGEFVKSFLE